MARFGSVRNRRDSVESGLPSSGSREPGDEVQPEPGASEEGEREERDTDQQRVDVEVPAQALGDAPKHARLARASQCGEVTHLLPRDSRPGVGLRRCVRHGSSVSDCAASDHRGSPRYLCIDPERAQGFGKGCDRWSGIGSGRIMVVMSQTVWEPRRAFRDPDDRLLAGVASGVAEHLGFEPTPVRFGFVALTLLGGLGVILYGCLWVMMPVRGSDPADTVAPGLASATRQGRRSGGRSRVQDVSAALSLTVLGLGAIILLQNAGLWINGRLFWPLLVAGAGVVLLWWRSDETDPERLDRRRRIQGLAARRSRGGRPRRRAVAHPLPGGRLRGSGRRDRRHPPGRLGRGAGRRPVAAPRAICGPSARSGSAARSEPTWRRISTTQSCRRWR